MHCIEMIRWMGQFTMMTWKSLLLPLFRRLRTVALKQVMAGAPLGTVMTLLLARPIRVQEA